jgi:hypothetical protein
MVRRCAGRNAAGEPCEAQPIRADGYCYWHSPALADERDRKRREGGRNSSNRARAAKALPAAALTPAELQGVLAVTLKAVLAEQKSPAIGNAIANLGRAIVAVREATEVEDRLAALEAAAGVAGRAG